MNLQQIQYFLKIYEDRNVGVAAQELFLTRSALSKALRELEKEFGVSLFTRSNTGLVPTEAADALHICGMELMSLVEKTNNVMQNFRSETDETVHLGMTPTTGTAIFPELYRKFTARHPETQLVPIEGGNKTQTLMDSGRMDACLTTYSEVFPDYKGKLKLTDKLECAKLYDTELVLCVRHDHPLACAKTVTVADILSEPLVFLHKPFQREAEIEHRFLDAGHTPNIVFRAARYATARQILLSGMASSVQVRGFFDDGTEVIGIPLSPPAVYANMLVWNKRSIEKKGFRKFLDFCLSHDFSGYR